MLHSRLQLKKLLKNQSICSRQFRTTVSAKANDDQPVNRRIFSFIENTGDEEPEHIDTIEKGPNYKEPKFVPFEDFIESGRKSAKSSVLIQTKSLESADDLTKYCQKHFGQPKGLYFHNNIANSDFSNFFLVEFENQEAVTEILQNHAKFRDDSKDHFLVSSPFLWLTSSATMRPKSGAKVPEVPIYLPGSDLAIHNNEVLSKVLNEKDTVSSTNFFCAD